MEPALPDMQLMDLLDYLKYKLPELQEIRNPVRVLEVEDRMKVLRVIYDEYRREYESQI